jgi:hypothetical protein
MRKDEAKFQTFFNKWVRESFKKTAAYELKSTRGKSSFPFREFKEHQERSLRIVRAGVLAYKIPDDSQSFKPFDSFSMSGERAYVVIKYPQFFCMIDIDTFILERDRSKRASLTAGRARDISTLTVEL